MQRVTLDKTSKQVKLEMIAQIMENNTLTLLIRVGLIMLSRNRVSGWTYKSRLMSKLLDNKKLFTSISWHLTFYSMIIQPQRPR